RRDYSLAEMSRLVESENAAVLSAFVSSSLDGSLIDVTLKINRQNVQPIISVFERFNYEIKATFNERDYTDTLRERYDLLMNYLNV
ncbi:MAG: CBS domain-containing protein, partial [Phaeodactylibacter sp.]|nr:CBS domain-containing protein [Phaeodactylibacter sp.]